MESQRQTGRYRRWKEGRGEHKKKQKQDHRIPVISLNIAIFCVKAEEIEAFYINRYRRREGQEKSRGTGQEA